MRRRNSAIGLVICLVIMNEAQSGVISHYPAIWNDVALLGALFFLVVLCIGPRKRQKDRDRR